MTMWEMREEMKSHIAMTVFQLGYAGNHVILRAALNLGISKLVFPIYRNLIALLLLFPFAYFLEKKDRPPLTASLLIQFFFLGFVGIASNQLFYLLGLDNTSPTLASATENAVPSVTFILATLLRLERVELKRIDGMAKVVGTVISFIGASVITLYEGPKIPTMWVSSSSSIHQNWTLGCIYNLGHCLCWSSWIVLQAIVLKKYPAPFSAYSFTCFFGILQFLGVASFFERLNPQAWQVHSTGELLSVIYSGVVVSGIGFGIQIWVIQRGGPVFVSGYLPLQTMLVAVISPIALGEEFHLGGVIGAILIISGLYMVLWGKTEETKVARAASVEEKEEEDDNQQPLIVAGTSAN